ncbi:Hypothetical predicted protein [Xyrichtys novacula]|uniref:Uncharacterized protein n=1 Tax=Xyrichtys novacula TaxID=13765 RepID=A0AAV1G5R1_XYRNO|nr:Hypothetical predicted protein [Xyrichtys novacula]
MAALTTPDQLLIATGTVLPVAYGEAAGRRRSLTDQRGSVRNESVSVGLH